MRTREEVFKKTHDKVHAIIHDIMDKNKKDLYYLNVGDVYLHFKHERDTDENLINYMYVVTDVAQHTETGVDHVIYKALYGDHKTYARPVDMFLSPVDKEKYHKIKQKERLKYIFNIYQDYITDPLCVDAIISFAKDLNIDLDGDVIVYEDRRYYVHIFDKIVVRLEEVNKNEV